MSRSEVISRLASHRDAIRQRFGVRSMALFGSVGRDEARDDSDVDLLVEFEGPSTARGFFDLKAYLEEVLGREVDLATRSMVGPALQRAIASELLRVA